jgi:hypothetical protein
MSPDVIQSLSVGVVLPFIAKFFDDYLPAKPFIKYVAILVVCGLAGGLITFFNGEFSPENFFVSLASIATVSQTMYMAFVKK